MPSLLKQPVSWVMDEDRSPTLSPSSRPATLLLERGVPMLRSRCSLSELRSACLDAPLADCAIEFTPAQGGAVFVNAGTTRVGGLGCCMGGGVVVTVVPVVAPSR